MNPRVLLVDIEGTTTKISFVKESLFPFVSRNLKVFLNEEFENIKDLLKELVELSLEYDGFAIDSNSKESTISTTIKFINELMALDKKVAPLKNLQGIIWKSAYEQGQIKGHVYDDVLDCLKRWKGASKPVYVYSSGSVFAQKLLFRYSIHGNLSAYFSGYFDTVNAGLKTEPGSFMKIFDDLKFKHGLSSPAEILFLTDNIHECRAASNVGFGVVNVKREGNADISIQDLNGFKQIDSFSEV